MRLSGLGANRTNDIRRIAAHERIRRDVLRDHRARSDDGVLADGHAADDRGTGGDPDVPADHDGLAGRDGPALRGVERMAGCNQAHVRSDHHVVGYVDAAEIVERTVLVDEDVAPDVNFRPAGRIKGRDQQEAIVHLPADELTEKSPHVVSVVERQAIEPGRDRHRPPGLRDHRGGLRRPPVDDPDALPTRHSFGSLLWIEAAGASQQTA